MSKSGIRDGRLYTFDDYEWLHGIFVIIALPVVLCVFICHTYKFILSYKTYMISNKLSKHSNDNKTETSVQSKSKTETFNTKKSKMEFPKKSDNLGIIYYYIWFIHLFTIASLICGVIDCIFSIFNYFHINGILNCQILTTIIVTCWGFNKNGLYYIGIFRILASFSNSAFAYSKTFIRIILISVTILVICAMTTIQVFGVGTSIYNDIKDYYWCQYSFPLIIVIISAILDISINTTLLILFIKPLVYLVQRNRSKTDQKILALIVKYCILVSIGIFSSSVTSLCLFFGIGSIQILDITVNLLCMILMSPIHRYYYDKLCGNCNHKISHVLSTKFVRNSNQKNKNENKNNQSQV